MFFDIVASAAITCVAEIFLVLNLNMVTGFLRQNGYQLHMFDMQGEGMLPWLLFYVFMGIAVFSICFLLLQENAIRYIGEISDAMEEIAEALNRDEKSVQNAIYRIRQKLRATIKRP